MARRPTTLVSLWVFTDLCCKEVIMCRGWTGGISPSGMSRLLPALYPRPRLSVCSCMMPAVPQGPSAPPRHSQWDESIRLSCYHRILCLATSLYHGYAISPCWHSTNPHSYPLSRFQIRSTAKSLLLLTVPSTYLTHSPQLQNSGQTRKLKTCISVGWLSQWSV